MHEMPEYLRFLADLIEADKKLAEGSHPTSATMPSSYLGVCRHLLGAARVEPPETIAEWLRVGRNVLTR